MPAGLSHSTQSNLVRRSAMTLPTPSSVSESLSRLCDAGNHIDQVEYHASFRAHHQIEVAQADIEVDHRHAFSELSERGTECGCGCGFSNATLAGCHDKNFGHC